jgi:hypothetical protein
LLSERGIPVPGDSTQVIYVWFDALANYISGLGSTSVEDSFNLWKNAGRITARLDKVLCTSADVLQCIGELLLPYLPESAIEILRRLNAKTTAGLPAEPPSDDVLGPPAPDGFPDSGALEMHPVTMKLEQNVTRGKRQRGMAKPRISLNSNIFEDEWLDIEPRKESRANSPRFELQARFAVWSGS